jgi:hypothetical protein
MVKDVFDKLNYKVVAAVAMCRTLGMVGTGTRTPEEEATTPAGSMTGKAPPRMPDLRENG